MEKSFIESLNSLEISGSEKQYYLEKYILYTLKNSIHFSGNKLFTEYIVKTDGDEAIRFDAVITSDWMDLKGPIILEIRNEIKKDAFKKIVKRINALPQSKIKTFLLIVNKQNDFIDEISYNKMWSETISSDIKLTIWDTKKFISNSPIKSIDLKVLSYSDLEKSFYKDSSLQMDNKLTKEYATSLLKESVQNEKVVFFLGSGVSKEYKLPLWSELINGLSNDVINILGDLHYLEKNILNKELSKLLGSNPLLAANYLESGITNNASFITDTNKVKQEFYPKLRSVLYQKYTLNNNNLTQLRYLAKGIIESTSEKGIQKVITYNYDDLLQQELKREDGNFRFQTVFENPDANNIDFSIYHVHGFLPKDESAYPNYNMKNQELIFTEESYLNLQKNKESWRNSVQVEALNKYTVVMIGLSLDDPNLRRLLMESRLDADSKNYILLRAISKRDSDFMDVLEEDVSTKFLNLHHQILKENFKRLGVEVLWYENHEDVSEILKNIFS